MDETTMTPDVTYPEHSLRIVFSHRDSHPRRDEGSATEEEQASVSGYCEVYELNGLWHFSREAEGGSTSSRGYDSCASAVQSLVGDVMKSWAYWDEKVRWCVAGDRTSDGRRVIRADGWHRTFGDEPSDRDLRDHRSSLGSAGHEFRFRVLATDEMVFSRNVWVQGRIPVEYRELLPDNAELVEDEPTRGVMSSPQPQHEHSFVQVIDRKTNTVVGYKCSCGRWRK